MVVISKILPLVALGAGLLFVINAFTRPAHASQTASALSESVSVLGTAGTSIADFGRGIGGGLAGLFQPVWEVSNLFERFSSLASGSANVSPVAQETTNPNNPTAPTYTYNSGSDGYGNPSAYTAGAITAHRSTGGFGRAN